MNDDDDVEWPPPDDDMEVAPPVSYIHGHEPGSYPSDRTDILQHNLSVVIHRLDAQSDTLDAVINALRDLERHYEILAARLAAVERATPYRAPKNPPQAPRRP